MEHLSLKVVMAGHSPSKDGRRRPDVPAIHVCVSGGIEDVNARHKAGHDGDLTIVGGARA